MKRRTFFLIILTGGIARLLTLPLVFDGGSLCFVGGPDAYYHFRRAELALAGSLTSVDQWTNFPHGDVVHWPNLYSRFLGFVLGAGGQLGLVIVPVFFGLLSLFVFKSWAENLLGDKAPLALLLLAILPASVILTSLGAIDHHCLEALLFITVLSCGRIAALIAFAVAFMTITTWPILLVGYLVTEMMMRRRAVALAGGMIGAVAIPLAAWNYFSDPWLIEIKEAKPMTLFQSFELISLGMIAIPLAALRWWRSRTSRPYAAAIGAAIVTLPLVLLQVRFVVFLAMPAALAIAEVTKLIAERARPRMAFLFLFAAVSLAASGLLEIITWRSDPPKSVRRALEFLRNETPIAGDYLAPHIKPAYGVVSSWDLGHAVLTLGMRPAVANAFHPGVEGRRIADQILFSTIDEARETADKNSVRYLLLTNLDRYAGRRDGAILFDRLYFSNDTTVGWARVYESFEMYAGAGDTVPAAQIWERSRGS